jgi:predicted AAA+ superfamily ATPase
MFKRTLNMRLPEGQSAFLWGARQTGKSSYLASHFPNSITYDLLDTYQLMRLTKSPWLLREEINALDKASLAYPIIIDEVQKVPALLNEVHWLIEHLSVQFILCGSSARKLKMDATNLLGGRAWKYHFFPLVFAEIPDFDLLRALQHGLVPKHYLADPVFINEYLEAYVDIYLTDEIRNEGLVRNLAGFARFLDVAGLSNGEMVNHSNVARDCGVDRATVSGFYQILIDTLLGYYIYPYNKKIKRDLITSVPKFYLFDVGVANYLARRRVLELKGDAAGISFEHLILTELIAYLSFHRKREKISYWRTKTGHEVDFIIGDANVAIEVKISQQVHLQDIKGLIAFYEEHPNTTALVVSQDARKRKIELENGKSITIIPWRAFLTDLWAGNIRVSKVQ